jgi:hypothetical protein
VSPRVKSQWNLVAGNTVTTWEPSSTLPVVAQGNDLRYASAGETSLSVADSGTSKAIYATSARNPHSPRIVAGSRVVLLWGANVMRYDRTVTGNDMLVKDDDTKRSIPANGATRVAASLDGATVALWSPLSATVRLADVETFSSATTQVLKNGVAVWVTASPNGTGFVALVKSAGSGGLDRYFIESLPF